MNTFKKLECFTWCWRKILAILLIYFIVAIVLLQASKHGPRRHASMKSESNDKESNNKYGHAIFKGLRHGRSVRNQMPPAESSANEFQKGNGKDMPEGSSHLFRIPIQQLQMFLTKTVHLFGTEDGGTVPEELSQKNASTDFQDNRKEHLALNATGVEIIDKHDDDEDDDNDDNNGNDDGVENGNNGDDGVDNGNNGNDDGVDNDNNDNNDGVDNGNDDGIDNDNSGNDDGVGNDNNGNNDGDNNDDDEDDDESIPKPIKDVKILPGPLIAVLHLENRDGHTPPINPSSTTFKPPQLINSNFSKIGSALTTVVLKPDVVKAIPNSKTNQTKTLTEQAKKDEKNPDLVVLPAITLLKQKNSTISDSSKPTTKSPSAGPLVKPGMKVVADRNNPSTSNKPQLPLSQNVSSALKPMVTSIPLQTKSKPQNGSQKQSPEATEFPCAPQNLTGKEQTKGLNSTSLPPCNSQMKPIKIFQPKKPAFPLPSFNRQSEKYKNRKNIELYSTGPIPQPATTVGNQVKSMNNPTFMKGKNKVLKDVVPNDY